MCETDQQTVGQQWNTFVLPTVPAPLSESVLTQLSFLHITDKMYTNYDGLETPGPI
jgi:hypothetical protein